MTEPTPTRPRRPLTRARLVGFVVLTLLLLWGLLEGALQVAAVVAGPQHHLPADGSLPEPDPAAFRVVAVGDSWVYGAESAPDEAFIEVFRRAASQRLGQPVQVYNLGVSASNSSQALLALAEVLEPVRPDLVVALTGANNQLHDTGVADAARLMGEDARVVPGLTWLSKLRTVRLARILWVSLAAPEAVEVTDRAGLGIAALPPPPPEHVTPVVNLPWWEFFAQRRYDVALTVLLDSPPPSDAPAVRGLRTAWEALLRAHLLRLDARDAASPVVVEELIDEALALGGDDVAAHEARAVLAELRGRPRLARAHRARAALAEGNPFLAELARGRVLVELEAWDGARAWLLAVQRAQPGQLEALVALAHLPVTVRTDAVEQLLYDGPRGLVTPPEYLEWHLQSSGMVDRAVGSLGDPDPNEPWPLRTARARSLELLGEPAAEAWVELLGTAATPWQTDEAVAGILRTAAPDAEVPAPVGPLGLLASAHRADRAGDCVLAVERAREALLLGASHRALEAGAGACLPRPVTWVLGEMVLQRTEPLDVAALVAGARPPGTPATPAFAALRRRASDITDPAWRPLAEALAGRAPIDGPDPAVRWLAEGLAHARRDRPQAALAAWAAAASGSGDPWARTLARGLGAALAGDAVDAQRQLLAAHAVSPGQLELLRALQSLPASARSPATDDVLTGAPVGELTRAEWVDWYRLRGDAAAAELAAELPWEPRTVIPWDAPAPPANELADTWLALRTSGGVPAAAAPKATPLLVRQLDAMHRLAQSQGGAFVALTYPFPSGHHAAVRETVLAGAAERGYPVLDLYGDFAAAFSQPEWEALRTPGDHVNATGYARMGEQLAAWAEEKGLLRQR